MDHLSVDVLVDNAGVMAIPAQRTADGFDLQTATNSESKLEIVLFSLELQRRLEAAGSQVRSVLAHPGIATTTLAAHSPAGRVNSLKFLLNDPERGALPTLFAASQDVPGNAYVGSDGLGSISG